MRVRLNGEDIEFKDTTTLSGVLKELNIEPRGVAVEVNMAVIKKEEYDGYELKDGDSIEIVRLVGGG